MIKEDAQALYESLNNTLERQESNIDKARELLGNCLLSGGKILVCGNGGSAAEAQHFVAEFIVRLKDDRKPLPAISLTTDSSIMTACTNDYCFEHVFARQVEALANEKDVLVCLTTSGKSMNLIEAAKAARKKNCKVLALTGEKESPLEKESDITLKVQSANSARIQEVQLFLIHYLAKEAEKPFFDKQ